MDLYIAEKPSLARILAEHLSAGQRIDTKQGYIQGKNWIMTWCIGHLYELYSAEEYDAAWGSPWKVSALPIIPTSFKYRPVEKTKQQLNVVHSLCSKATRIFNAGDPDRCGQEICDLVIKHSTFKGPVFRVWPDDLSPSGLKKVFSKIKPNSEYRSLSLSAQCRSHADWLVGINFTRFYTCIAQEKGFQGTLSLGRVQTVAFSIIYNRCIEIENFSPLTHFGLDVILECSNGEYSGEWVIPEGLKNEQGYFIDKRKTEQVESIVKSGQGIVKEVLIENKSEVAPLLFSLSMLQTFSSKKWGYSAKQVLNACQYLYEELKSLTYPRTDCSYLSEGDFKDALEISAVIGSSTSIDINNLPLNFTSKPRCYNDSKTTAHTGIIPTLCPPDFKKFDSLSSKEKQASLIGDRSVLENIYNTVALRFLAQFMPKHDVQSTKIITGINGYEFKTTSKVITALGWKLLLHDESTKEHKHSLPVITKGESIKIMGSTVSEKKTKPPEYFTEGTLIAALSNISNYVDDQKIRQKLRETDGIGTEATRADIIERIKKVGYVRVDGKKLIVTPLGRDVYPFFPIYFKTPAMTAIWESALQGIAEARLDHNAFERNIISWTETQIKKLKNSPPDIKVNIDDKYQCKNCSSTLIRKKGKYGNFWACINRDCGQSYNDFKLSPLYPLEGDGNDCSECKTNNRMGIMKTRVMKENRDKGQPAKVFLGCDQYPECKHAEW
tara:strand:+ start:51157 stop:53325 length:2169 start_codon:yes stop_codon:yes gene_type:complete